MVNLVVSDRSHVGLAVCCALAVMSLSCARRPPVAEPASVDLRELLGAAQDARKPMGTGGTLAGRLSETHPMWPIREFLAAEARLLRGETSAARSAYRKLCEWAEADPNGDHWGGSALAAIALWRWIELLATEGAPAVDEVGRVLQLERELLQARLVRRMFDDPVFSSFNSLPQVEEEIVRRLAALARRSGEKDRAMRLFLDYLALARSPDLSPEEEQLKNEVIGAGLAALDRLTLLRGRRLMVLRKFEEAYPLLEQASHSPDLQVRAEASLHLARAARIRNLRRERRVQMLSTAIEDATDPDVVQWALLDRAQLFQDMGVDERALADLERLAGEFPGGRLNDDALWRTAQLYESSGETTKAIEYFDRLRSLDGPNDFRSMAPFHAAMLLYADGVAGQKRRASELLEGLNRALPSGPLRRNALFWLGRIAEESGERDLAAERFRELVTDTPYDYYAIRARMHLHMGTAAARQFSPDDDTRRDLRTAYQQSHLDATLGPGSFYVARLRGAIKTGLYAESLAADQRFRDAFPSRRLEDVSTRELEQTGLLPSIALWLALRQDALAAKDTHLTAEHRLRVAASVGKWAGDWPLAVSLTLNLREPAEVMTSLQRDPRYLSTAYPALFVKPLLKTGATYGVAPELLYSIMREESLFSPVAQSSDGALGLFQYWPSTFKNLDGKWHLLRSSGVPSMEAFLLDPERSIDLAGRWFGQVSLPGHKGDTLLAILEHHVGLPRLRDWMAVWDTQGRQGDVEYMVETAPRIATRRFVRRVFSTLAIAEAAGIVRPQGTAGH